MSAIRQFEDLECWQSARRLNQILWSLIARGAFKRDFALADQINRSAGSAMDNIAEGFDSGSDAEFARFLRYAQRSCSEFRSQSQRALDRGHLDEAEFQELGQLALEVSSKSGALINYLVRN